LLAAQYSTAFFKDFQDNYVDIKTNLWLVNAIRCDAFGFFYVLCAIAGAFETTMNIVFESVAFTRIASFSPPPLFFFIKDNY